MSFDEKNPFDTNFNLCVVPTVGETQYEAFQSIFARIMFAHIDNKNIIYPSPYEILCKIYNIQLINKKPKNVIPGQKYIIFDGKTVTHYKAFLNGNIYDPYKYYQAKGTQGYCQMFAFFIAINDIYEFEIVDQSKKIDIDNFAKLAYNSQVCFEKSLKIIKSYTDVLTSFNYYFNDISNNNLESSKYGITLNTNLLTYFKDYEYVNNDILNVMYYIYDQPLKGYRPFYPKLLLWNYIKDVKNNNNRNKRQKT